MRPNVHMNLTYVKGSEPPAKRHGCPNVSMEDPKVCKKHVYLFMIAIMLFI